MIDKRRKIVIIGAGHVGSHCGYSLLSQGDVNEIIFIDIDADKAAAQAGDISDAGCLCRILQRSELGIIRTVKMQI